MILAFELIKTGPWHAMSNAGIIALIKRASPNERVVFVAEKSHIQNVSALLSVNHVLGVEFIEADLPYRKYDFGYDVDLYAGIIERFIREYQSADLHSIMVLSAYRSVILAVYKLERAYNNLFFVIGLHDVMEQFVKKNTPIHWLYRALRYKQRPIQDVFNKLRTDQDNIRFLIHTPTYQDLLKKVLRPHVMNRIYYVHNNILYKKPPIAFKQSDHDRIIVDIHGAAANSKAKCFIKLCGDIIPDDSVEFRVLLRTGVNFNSLKNTIVVKNHDITDDDIVDNIVQSDYVLVPYDKTEYRLTCSGIFWDAINNGKPVLMLNSPFFDSFIESGIGIHAESVRELAEKFADSIIRNNDVTAFAKRCRGLSSIVQEESLQQIRVLLDMMQHHLPNKNKNDL